MYDISFVSGLSALGENSKINKLLNNPAFFSVPHDISRQIVGIKMPGDQFCLRWNNHHPNLISVFSSLLQNDQMVDVTLILDNREIHAHKIVLSACSPFFQVTTTN